MSTPSRTIHLQDWRTADQNDNVTVTPFNQGAPEPFHLLYQQEKRKVPCGVKYTRFVYYCRYLILLFWLVGGGLGAWFGPQFLNHTKDIFDPPSGSPAAIAKEKWNQYFPSQSHLHTAIIVLHKIDGTSLIQDAAALAYCQHVDNTLRRELNSSSATLEYGDRYKQLVGYFDVTESSIPIAAVAFLGKNEATMFWVVRFEPDDNSMTKTIGLHIRGVVDELNLSPEVYTIGVTGSDYVNYAIGEGTASDMINTDSIILPIAMVVLCCYLKSLRLMVLPLLCVGLSFVTSLSVMLPISIYAWNVASFAPSIMMSLTVAMSIDYSLFMLTRYREEILNGLHQREIEAVAATVTHSGEVLLASGLTLAITFASLIAFPMDFLSSIGLSASVTILSCLLVNLTVTPAMLLAFPSFFSDFRMYDWVRCMLPKLYTEDVPYKRFGDHGLEEAFVVNERHDLEEELMWSNPDSSSASSVVATGKSTRLNRLAIDAVDTGVSFSVRSSIGIVGDDGIDPAVRARRSQNPRIQSLRDRQRRSCWYRSAVCSTTNWVSWLLLILVVGGSIPFILSCVKLTHTIDQGQLLPRGSAAVNILDQVQEYLSPGLLGQYNILVVLDQTKLSPSLLQPVPILSPVYFNFTQQLVNELLTRDLIGNLSLTSIVGGTGGIWVEPTQAAALLAPSACSSWNPIACGYQFLFNHSTDAGLNSSCSLITMTTPFIPIGDESQPWVAAVRDLMGEMQSHSDTQLNGAIELYLTGGAVTAIDAVDRIFELFPYVVLATIAVVLLVIGIVFRSLFVPLRLILTLALPLVYTYGLAIMIFQENDFDWIGSIVSRTHSIYWLDPVMAFSILVGLGLDYDVFLYSRINEYRRVGYSTTGAIRKGVYKTGSIITGAGLIMAIAFFGLMLSKELVLNIFGFMLCFAVLFDTFIIRTLLVPAILNLAGEANWYPTTMPKPTQHELDEEGEEEIQAATSGIEEYSFR